VTITVVVPVPTDDGLNVNGPDAESVTLLALGLSTVTVWPTWLPTATSPNWMLDGVMVVAAATPMPVSEHVERVPSLAERLPAEDPVYAIAVVGVNVTLTTRVLFAAS
jgi:hypothetical protein